MHARNKSFWRRLTNRSNDRRPAKFVPRLEPLEDRRLCSVSQDVFFLHQSVGQGIMDDHGGRPGLVSQIEAAGHGFHDYSLWDSPPGGSVPTQIASLFADGNGDSRYGDLLEGIPGAREAGVLLLKSCFYTLADLENAGALADWQQAFIDDVAAYANQNPQQKLVVMPAVPERRSSGLSAEAAARGRAWSDWLAGDFPADYSTQHNVFSFNLFDFLADPASDPGNANYQREEYLNGDHGDSHPNDTAYSAAADAIAEFVLTTVIGGGNHAPVAGSQSVSTAQDAAVAITLAASDADHDPLTYEIVAGPASGTLDLAGNVATYTPTAGWHGDDGFTFRAYDGQAWSNTATVGITVYDPNPVVTMPLRNLGSSALLRRSGERIQVVNQRDGQFLLDQPLDSLHSLTVTGAATQSDTLTVDLAEGGFTLAGGVLFDGAAGSKTDTLVLRGTTGADTFSVNAVSATASGLAVQFVRVEQVTLDGGAGDDVYQVDGLGAKTSIADSRGTDTLDFSAAALGMNVNLASSSSQTVFSPSNRNALSLKGTIENAIGTPWADKIRGNSAANRIEGRAGNDTIYGRSGNDWLYGGEGSDSLYGESGNDVLLGGEGDDRLEASTGKNLLIGGLGADYLKGSSGEEILISGTTVYDGNDAALAAIMAEWTSTRSFRQRTDRLDAGIAYGISQTAQLKQRDAMNPDGTVIDDGIRNVLYGGWGSDWFLGFLPTDDVRDRGRSDR
jgi:Ca2+-binding RTX toxin-like protein